MSDQLATEIRDIVDGGAPPITLAELKLVAMAGPPPRARRHWPMLSAAAAAVVLLVALVGGVAFVVDRDSAPDVAVGAGPSSVPTTSALPNAGSTLVTSWAQQYVGIVFVYADGRVIWDGGPPRPEGGGAWERHLNAAGLDLVRSGDLAARELVAGNVPSNAWADPTKIAWTPSEYAACLWQSTATSSGPFLGPTDTVVARLPASVRELLHTPTKEKIAAPDSSSPGSDLTCFSLTPQEAAAARDLPPVLIPATTTTPAIGVMILSVLPDGKLFLWGS
jgi:hypothetical protein